jgi:DNA-binding CsgD family transcriptional regulator
MNSGTWWLRSILSASSFASLRESLLMVVQRTGFKFFILCNCGPQLDGLQEIRLDNCPSGWLESRSERKFSGTLDPLHRLALQGTTPILWRDTVTHYPEYFCAARKFGLVTGVTHPVHGPVGARTSISFIKGVGGIQAEREILSSLPECQLITSYAHRVVDLILQKRPETRSAATPESALFPPLTARERECLSWIATGKTAGEVAATLALSEATIIYHLTKARRKLNAENSRHAISRAISLRLIAPT